MTRGANVTDYVGNAIYENGVLKRILVDGGYIENGVYHFYLTDHLGNNRIIADQSGAVVQSTQYYPYGMALADGTNPNAQPYKYNGKELDSDRGLNLYDYEARYMDPALGRFTTMDPMAEKYYSISPYVYCAGNPVKYVDPTGMLISPYYDKDGNYLGVDEKGFAGDIYITNRETFDQYFNNGVADSKAIQGDANTKAISANGLILTPEAESNIYTHVMSKTEGVDFSRLYNGKVSIVTDIFRRGEKQIIKGFNDPDPYRRYGFGKTASGAFKITAKSGSYSGNSGDFTTVEAIQNYLGVHEYDGHGNKDFSGGKNPGGTHWKAYELQIRHPTFKSLTPGLKQEVRTRIKEHMLLENRNLYYQRYGK